MNTRTRDFGARATRGFVVPGFGFGAAALALRPESSRGIATIEGFDTRWHLPAGTGVVS